MGHDVVPDRSRTKCLVVEVNDEQEQAIRTDSNWIRVSSETATLMLQHMSSSVSEPVSYGKEGHEFEGEQLSDTEEWVRLDPQPTKQEGEYEQLQEKAERDLLDGWEMVPVDVDDIRLQTAISHLSGPTNDDSAPRFPFSSAFTYLGGLSAAVYSVSAGFYVYQMSQIPLLWLLPSPKMLIATFGLLSAMAPAVNVLCIGTSGIFVSAALHRSYFTAKRALENRRARLSSAEQQAKHSSLE